VLRRHRPARLKRRRDVAAWPSIGAHAATGAPDERATGKRPSAVRQLGGAPQRPTGPAPGLVYAGFWIRVLAWIIDAIALGIITSALGPAFGTGTVVPLEDGRFAVDYGASGLGSLVGLVYFVGMWAWRGQTLGMMPFNLKVLRADDGGPVDIVRALLRYVGLVISFVVILIGVIWVAFDSRKQGWHDKMASTVVVRPA
jgi:uncharacterized RDD family membrane protein YckC